MRLVLVIYAMIGLLFFMDWLFPSPGFVLLYFSKGIFFSLLGVSFFFWVVTLIGSFIKDVHSPSVEGVSGENCNLSQDSGESL